jgi:hypothetical protein
MKCTEQTLSESQIDEEEMGGECGTNGGEEKRIEGSGRETWVKGILGGPTFVGKNNIKMGLKKE